MPCSSGEGPNYYEDTSKIDHLTNMLCGLCTRIENTDSGYLLEDDESLMKWWDQHKKEDNERKALEESLAKRQKLKEEALSKLTKEEREALGLR